MKPPIEAAMEKYNGGLVDKKDPKDLVNQALPPCFTLSAARVSGWSAEGRHQPTL